MIGDAIFAKLSAAAPLVALVDLNIYPLRAPAGTKGNHIIWQQIYTKVAPTHGEATGTQFDAIQFSCFASSYEEAVAIRSALNSALDNQQLSTGDKPTKLDERTPDEDGDLIRADVDYLI